MQKAGDPATDRPLFFPYSALYKNFYDFFTALRQRVYEIRVYLQAEAYNYR